MKKILTPLIFVGLALPATAQAQSYGNKSVTVYSLDGPPVPIEYVTPTPPMQLSPAPASARASTVAAAEAMEETVEASTDIATTSGDIDWSGRVNLGASMQTGNTEQDAINADATLKAKWNDKHRATLEAEYNRETEDDERTEDNKRLEGQYDYFFNEQWFLNSSLGFEQDDIAELDLRTTLGVGLGHQPFDRDDLHLQYILGPTYLREEFENGDSEDSLAAHWALDYDQKVWDDTFQLFHNHDVLVPVDATDAFLFDSKTGIRAPLRKGLVATAEVDFEWDNDPEPGIKEDDTTYAIKLGYEWD